MKTISALVVVALGLLGGMTLLWRELDGERQRIADSTSTAGERLPATESSPVPIPVQSSTASDQPSEQVDSPDKVVPRGISPASLSAQMQSPEGQARTRDRLRSMLESSLPDVGEVLGLTTAEKDALLDLLATQQTRGVTTLAPENESAQESEARQQRAYDAHVAELQALLGSKYPEWRDYEETVPVRMEGRALRADLDALGIPLTQTQERALIEALVTEQLSINQPVRTSRGVTIRRTAEIRQRLVSAAIPYLSAQQLDGYQALLERRAALQEALTGRMESRD